jgi:hypothetical protein
MKAVRAAPPTRLVLWTSVLSATLIGTCSGQRSKEEVVTMNLTSTAFAEGGMIPVRHTCDGDDVSPALRWSSSPDSAKSFALACTDPDAPAGTWVHWVLFNLPPSLRELPEGTRAGRLPQGASEGTNDFGRRGYGGPCPPPGPAHRYYFRLYALDTTLALSPGARLADLARSMDGHVLAEAQLMGKYARR